MLAEADLRILAAVRSPTSITELSERTEYSLSYLSERVSHLEEWDLVATTNHNRSKNIRALHTPVFEAYRDLSAKHPHIDFPSLISPSLLRVCWFLDRETPVGEMLPRLLIGKRRIYQLLEQLQSRGFITKNDNRYVFTNDLEDLAHFAQTVTKYEHQRRAETLVATATVVWSAPHEALITTPDESPDTVQETFDNEENWQMTGLPRFADYGLEFFPAAPPPFFYSGIRDALTPGDFIAHTLLLDADPRNLSYSALLLIAADVPFDELRSTAWYYDIEATVDALITFVETHGGTRHDDVPLPDWGEMTSLASQYGVTV